jgi:hypothetical protein
LTKLSTNIKILTPSTLIISKQYLKPHKISNPNYYKIKKKSTVNKSAKPIFKTSESNLDNKADLSEKANNNNYFKINKSLNN